MNTIEGTIEEVIYKNEANGYCVLEVKHGDDLITVVGYIPFANPGESLRLSGKWTTHPDYGEQLKVEYFEKIEPSTEDAIEKYLGSGIIKGIGPVTARKIIEKFGSDALIIIENNPEKLSAIKGISVEKAISIGNAYMEQRELKNVVMFLQKYNISPTFAVRIFKSFGSKTIETIKANPYKLADEVFGIGFKTADKIAMTMGVDKNSEHRLCSGIKYVLYQFSLMGHSFVPKEELLKYSSGLLEADADMLENAMMRLMIDREIYIEEIDEYEAVYLASFYKAEQGTVAKLMELSLYNVPEKIKDIDSKIHHIEKEQGIVLEEMQKTAIKASVENGVIVVTGGPGTGKTTIIKSMISLFNDLKFDIALAAPTGRAAKRMSEACGREAKTIHRLLEIGYIEDGEEQVFTKNENNLLDYDVVIIDEVSMVDVLLMHNLLKAIKVGTRLILVGDTDQLPSVGPGRVLKDFISSEMIRVVRLTEIFRQAQESMIIVNAHRINKGEEPYFNTKDKDFFFIKRYNQQQILLEIKGLVKDRLRNYYGYDPVKDIQILTPMRKGLIGVLNLNNEIQSMLNPPSKRKKEKQSGDVVFREGDKVMQIKNNYNMIWQKVGSMEEGTGVFNGDIGYIKNIDLEVEILTVIFDDEKIVHYGFGELDELELAYAVTVHKSQGCEFPVVVMPVFSGPAMLLTRNLLYTAITRARKLVVLVGKEEYLKQMIDNNTESKRYSGLTARLKNAASLNIGS